MRLLAEIIAQLSIDNDKKRKLIDYAIKLDDNLSTAVEASSGYIELAESAADYVVPFGSVAKASFVLILADQEITVKLDGIGQTAIPLRPILASAVTEPLSSVQESDQPGILLLRGRLSTLHASNPSAAAKAKFFYLIVGEAAA
jgi:hypothetical protein